MGGPLQRTRFAWSASKLIHVWRQAPRHTDGRGNGMTHRPVTIMDSRLPPPLRVPCTAGGFLPVIRYPQASAGDLLHGYGDGIAAQAQHQPGTFGLQVHDDALLVLHP